MCILSGTHVYTHVHLATDNRSECLHNIHTHIYIRVQCYI